MKLTVIYLGRSAPLVPSVVVSVEVDHTTARQLRALLTALSKGLSSESSQGLLKVLPGLLAETLERKKYEILGQRRTS